MLSHTGPLTLLHPRDEDERWAWARWLVPRLAVARSDGSTRAALARDVTGPHLVVVVRPARVENALEGWGTQRRGPADALVVVAEEPRNGSAPPDAPGPRADDGTADRDVPSWCRWTLGTGPRARLTGPGTDRRLEVWTAGTTWAERTARRLAPAAAPADTGGALPARAALADLLPTEPADLARRWSALGAPTCPIGVGTSGVVELDLRRDGPHALVAGTTGAGKSELLQSLVLGLAHARPPGELAFVLVDYKGGAGFGHCRDLPHVVGTVTDLDENGAARAVHAVRAELRRREQLLAAAGVADLESLRAVDPHAPPALVMVVDELRALVDDMPDAVPALIRIATQGRSLGVHLVLATQRPAGAVNAELRANLALRICLRVADEADSLDVVDAPDAAAIAPACAGRALVRRGPGSPEAVQTAWAAGQPRAARPPARRAPAWREVEWPAHDEATQHGLAAASDDGVDHALTLVRTVRAAARLAGSAAPAAPWLAPLPARISPDDVPRLLAAGAPAHDGPALGTADTGPARDEGLLLGITDLPAERRRGVVRWRPASGPLLVAGPPGSGRSTALRTVAAAALASGHHVHVLHAAARPLALPATVGTVVGADDPRRVQRLADLLSRGHAPAPHVLLVDDVGAVVRALDETTREGGTTLLDQLVRARVPIAVAGLPGDAARLLPHARDLLALGRPDVADTALLGLPAHAPGTRPDASVAGRGRHRGTSGVQVCQVVLADPAAATLPAGTPEPPRLRALPAHVRPDDLPADPPGTLVTVGLGGDEAGAVRLEVAAGALVVGPPGTGRTTALRTLTARLARQGWEVITPPPHRLSTEALGELTVARAAPRALVVDDLDLRLRADPLMEAALETLAEPRGPHVPGTPAPPVLVASSRTEAAATAFRGPLATLRNHAALVLLAPLEPGSREVAGTDLRAEADPAHPRLPGRGVVVERGRVTGVQVADAQAGPP
nr:FtsK/SpoIIIE domain-containing protein [Cellulomonas sp. APG4]